MLNPPSAPNPSGGVSHQVQVAALQPDRLEERPAAQVRAFGSLLARSMTGTPLVHCTGASNLVLTGRYPLPILGLSRVLSGELAPRKLVTMTPSELANQELQQEREALLKKALADSV